VDSFGSRTHHDNSFQIGLLQATAFLFLGTVRNPDLQRALTSILEG